MEKIQNPHNAMASGIGTMYQFLYFVRKCLSLHKGEEISLEHFDDVDVVSSEEENRFFQLKHTMQRTKSKYINMSAHDADFWKTIHVWIDMAKNSGEIDGNFLENSRFILVTNKNLTDNEVIKKISQYQNDEIPFYDIKDSIEQLKLQSEDNAKKNHEKRGDGDEEPKEGNVLRWIKEALNYVDLDKLLKRIDFVCSSIDDLICDIKNVFIGEKYYNKDTVDELYSEYLGEIVKDWLGAGSEGKKYLSYTYEGFAMRFERTFSKYRSQKFEPKRNIKEYKFDPLKTILIKQLIDIDDIRVDDTKDIETYVLQMLNFDNYYQDADRKHYINDHDKSEFKDDTMRCWHNVFKQSRHLLPGEDAIAAARRVLNETRKIILTLGGVTLDEYFSTGCYYSLSNIPEIGWQQNWEVLYK